MKKTIITLGMAICCFATSTAASFVSANSAETVVSIPRGATPLCVAISKGEFDFVKKMVEYGADVNERSNGLTPLMIAATYNRSEIIEFLLEKGADVKATNDAGYTALRFAQISKSQEAADLLSRVK